jgi:hypothetical protein
LRGFSPKNSEKTGFAEAPSDTGRAGELSLSYSAQPLHRWLASAGQSTTKMPAIDILPPLEPNDHHGDHFHIRPPGGEPTVRAIPPPPSTQIFKCNVAQLLTPEARDELQREGALFLPGVLTDEFCEEAIAALTHIERLGNEEAGVERPANYQGLTQDIDGRHTAYGDYAAEHSELLASLIAAPELLQMAEAALGPEFCYDECVTLNREQGCEPHGWHTHPYAEDDPSKGLVRVFFYLNGFNEDDGALQVRSSRTRLSSFCVSKKRTHSGTLMVLA